MAQLFSLGGMNIWLTFLICYLLLGLISLLCIGIFQPQPRGHLAVKAKSASERVGRIPSFLIYLLVAPPFFPIIIWRCVQTRSKKVESKHDIAA